jgi:multidrug efflux pump subunit AcrB
MTPVGDPAQSSADLSKRGGGAIGWMVRHGVAPNVLMFMLILGGVLALAQMKQEILPEFELDVVTVRVPYPGASPAEVEQGIVLVVEEAIRGVDGIDEVTSVAAESIGTITAELEDGADRQRAYQDIQQAVERITTFPQEAEDPIVAVASRSWPVLQVQVYGDVAPLQLREAAEHVREALLGYPTITQINLRGVRDFEVRIEISQENLRRYGLTLTDVATALRQAAIELPSGAVDTAAGEILLRVDERRDWADEFAATTIRTTSSGSFVTLADVASVVQDDFEDRDSYAFFNGQPAIGIGVNRVGNQTPTEVATAVREAMEEVGTSLPPRISWAVSSDNSIIFGQRAELLIRNALIGLCLVLVVLGGFLEIKLAFWTTVGIGVAFVGSFLVLPLWAVSINMISMFAFIISLGIVVDDAIIVGENIYEKRQQGLKPLAAAIRGAGEMAVPVTFAVLTNIMAFVPLLMVPGFMGKISANIPAVVISVFVISLIESLVILPAHLKHARAVQAGEATSGFAPLALLHRGQQAISRGLSRLIVVGFGPVLRQVLRYRYPSVVAAFMLLLLAFGWLASGRIGFIPMPRVESDRSVVTVTLPFGAPPEVALAVRQQLEAAAETVAAAHGGDDLVEGVFTQVNGSSVEAQVYLTPPGIRPITTGVFTSHWREAVGAITEAESIRFESDLGGPGSGAALSIELAHADPATLQAAAAKMATYLAEYPETKDINDGYTPGKRQFDVRLNDDGRALGLTAQSLALQLRDAFLGAEAIRQQRGRHEVTVRLRRPAYERASEADVDSLLIRTPSGASVPLLQVATIERGYAYTEIDRSNGRRVLTVTADVEPLGASSAIVEQMNAEVFPEMRAAFPGLRAAFTGQQQEFRDSNAAILAGFIFALAGIYALLTIPFRSYVQPLIVMFAIPFGIFGAVIGHVIMGYNMSIISMMGLLALSGVVVNDSLVLITHANERRAAGLSAAMAVWESGVRRFRPILLTTITTFAGLAPMIFETSLQARFLIPMALSLGFGIVFATGIILLLVPALYVVVDDILSRLDRFRRWLLHAPVDAANE